MRSSRVLFLAFPFVTLLFATAAEPAKLPETFLVKPGQKVLLLGDSIIAPGMYGHVMNTLLDRLYPGHGVTFHSFGIAGISTKTMGPALAKALTGQTYDWVLINLGHNDVGQYPAEEFQTVHGPALLAAVRKLHTGRLGWMSLVGSEPSPYFDLQERAQDKGRFLQVPPKVAAYAAATQALCAAEQIAYVPLHETVSPLLAARAQQDLRLAFTMDGVHPNLLGNWVIGAALLQALGLRPPATEVELLQADATADHGRRPVTWLPAPVTLKFPGLFLAVKLLPPPSAELPCPLAKAPITVDGDLAEWGDAPACALAAPRHVTMELTPRATGYAASLRAARDATNLYFAGTITEPDVGEGAWFPEIVELLVDARKDPTRSGNVWQRTPGLTQFCVHRDFTDAAAPTHARAMANGDAKQGAGIAAAARRVAGGYSFELAIPLANFALIEVKEGSGVPFNWAVSYTDQAINLDWLGLMSRSSSTYGYGRLVWR